MKRFLRFLPFAAIMLSCALSFTACGDDESDINDEKDGIINNNGNNNGGTTGGDSIIIENTKLLQRVGDLIFKYNENNSLTSIEKSTYGDENSKMEVTYNPLTFRYTSKYNSESWNENNVLIVSNINLNANGHVTSCTFVSDYQYNEYESKGGNKDNGNIAFQYNGTNLTGIALNGIGCEYEEEDGEKYSFNYNFARNCILTWNNGNLQNITVSHNAVGEGVNAKLNSSVTFKYGDKQNKTAQFTHAFTEFLSSFFMEDEFTGLCHMNLLGEPSINFPISASVTQTEEESYYNNYTDITKLEATENYKDYCTDEYGYLTSYYTEGNFKYTESDYEGYENHYSHTTNYNYIHDSNNIVTPDSVASQIDRRKSFKERKLKKYFNRKK